MKRRMLVCLIVLLAACLCAADARAAGRTGSLTVVMRAGEEPVSGGVLALYRIGAEPDADPTPEYAQELEAQMQPGTGIRQSVGADGKVVFSELEPGVYLVTQPEARAGYRKLRPFFVSVPMRQDGELLYDIVAYPKLETQPANPGNPDTGQQYLLLLPLVLSGGGLLALLFGRRRGA